MAKKPAPKKEAPRVKVDPKAAAQAYLKTMAATAATAKRDITTAGDVMNTWRWIDFWDFARDRPCLPMERLYRTRGILCGRVLCWNGEEHAGKSGIAHYVNACAQRHGSHVKVSETEGVDSPPHFLATLGVDPDAVLRERPADVHACLKDICAFIGFYRGGKWILPGDEKATDYGAGADPHKDNAIVYTVDSVSNLAGNSNVKSEHAMAFSKWFRDDMATAVGQTDTVLQLTCQLKAHMEIGGQKKYGGKGGKTNTHLAEGTIKYLSTWITTIRHSTLRAAQEDGEEGGGAILGEVISLTVGKNKLGGTKGYTVKPHLMREPLEGTRIVWSFDAANKLLLTGPDSPILDDEWTAKGAGGYYGVSFVAGGAKFRLEQFLDELYADEEAVNLLRERMQILGFGFAFEKDYQIETVGSASDEDAEFEAPAPADFQEVEIVDVKPKRSRRSVKDVVAEIAEGDDDSQDHTRK